MMKKGKQREPTLRNTPGDATAKPFLPGVQDDGLYKVGGKEVSDVLEQLVGSDQKESGGWTLVLRDTGEKKTPEKQDPEQERLALVGQLVSGIAHDFNNQLTLISGFTEILQMRNDIPSEARECLDCILDSGHRAAGLVRQILDFSCPPDSDYRPLDLAALMEDTARLLRRIFPSNIHVSCENDSTVCNVNGDVTKLCQILMNLAINSRDAMAEGGQLSFRISRANLSPRDPSLLPGMKSGEWVRLECADTGSGIPQDILPHIFDTYVTTKEPGKGTGLGLAQVERLVRQHDGHITVTTEENEGTVFTIFFPLSNEEVTPDNHGDETSLDGSGMTLLVVEDEPGVLLVILTMLETFEFEVLPAMNGRQALELFHEHRDKISMVITDIVMPEMGGVELIRTLHREDPHLKISIITGYPRDAYDEVFELDNIAGHIEKPLRRAQLVRVLRYALRNQASHERSAAV